MYTLIDTHIISTNGVIVPPSCHNPLLSLTPFVRNRSRRSPRRPPVAPRLIPGKPASPRLASPARAINDLYEAFTRLARD